MHLNTIVKGYNGDLVKMDNGEEIRTRNFIWTAGVTGAAVKGLNSDDLIKRVNRFKVDRYNQIKDTRIFLQLEILHIWKLKNIQMVTHKWPSLQFSKGNFSPRI